MFRRDSSLIKHRCTLDHVEPIDQYINKQGPLRAFWSRWSTVSEWCPKLYKYFKSKAAIRAEKQRHLYFYPCIIHPFSRFRLVWNTFMILVYIMSYLLIPYQAFIYVIDIHKHTEGMTILRFASYIFALDILLNISTGSCFRKDNLNYIELDIFKNILYYLKTFFVVDTISTFPYLLACCTDETTSPYTRASSDLMVLKFSRFFTVLGYIHDVLEILGSPDIVIHVVILVLSSLIFLHWAICLQFLPGIFLMHFFDRPREEFWFDRVTVNYTEPYELYIVAAFRGMGSIFGIGFDDYNPMGFPDKNYITLIVILGSLHYIIVKAQLIDLNTGAKSHKIRYEEMMSQIESYVKHKCLPRALQNKVKKFYVFNYREAYFNEEQILNCVSAELRKDILMYNMRTLVENISFFTSLPTSLLRRIVSRLKREIFLKNDVIVKCGDFGNSMYFVASGSVAAYTPAGIEVYHLEDGTFFGEIALVTEERYRIASYIALETCETFRLSREDFEVVIVPYTDLLRAIEKMAFDRLERIRVVEMNFRRRAQEARAEGRKVHRSVSFSVSRTQHSQK